MNAPIYRQCLFLLTVQLLGSLFTVEATETLPADIIKYRQNIMQSQCEHMAAALAITEGKVDYTDQLAIHIHSLVATTRELERLFPAGTDQGNTRALASVWTDRSTFHQRAEITKQKAEALEQTFAACDTSNYSTRLNELLDSCKTCHQDFRKAEHQ